MDKRKEGNSLENKLSKLLQLTKNKESTSHKVKEVQRSYSPTSILTHQTTKMKPIVNHHEKKPIKETNNVIKHYKPIIKKKNPQKAREDKILDKLKNFDNIEELEIEIKNGATNIADIFIDIGLAIFLLNLINKKGERILCARLISVTFGIGFVIGTVSAGIRGINVFVIPDVLGFILSYTAFLFTFPEIKSEVDDK